MPPFSALAERIRAGEDLVEQEAVAVKNNRHHDWISLFAAWRDHTIAELEAVYEGSGVAIEFDVWTDSSESYSTRTDFKIKQEKLQEALKKLRDLVGGLELAVEAKDVQSGSVTVRRRERAAGPPNRNVFLVHGKEAGGFLKRAKRFLKQLDLTAVILAEEANEGRTLTEEHTQKEQGPAQLIPAGVTRAASCEGSRHRHGGQCGSRVDEVQQRLRPPAGGEKERPDDHLQADQTGGGAVERHVDGGRLPAPEHCWQRAHRDHRDHDHERQPDTEMEVDEQPLHATLWP